MTMMAPAELYKAWRRHYRAQRNPDAVRMTIEEFRPWLDRVFTDSCWPLKVCTKPKTNRDFNDFCRPLPRAIADGFWSDVLAWVACSLDYLWQRSVGCLNRQKPSSGCMHATIIFCWFLFHLLRAWMLQVGKNHQKIILMHVRRLIEQSPHVTWIDNYSDLWRCRIVGMSPEALTSVCGPV